jgi:hypothetical protein
MTKWQKPIEEWERDDLDEMADAIDMTITARRIAQRFGLDDLDDMALTDKLLGVVDEIERRNTEDEAAALAEYWKEAFI